MAAPSTYTYRNTQQFLGYFITQLKIAAIYFLAKNRFFKKNKKAA